MKRAKWILGAVSLAVLTLGLGFWAGSHAQSPQQAAADARAPKPGPITAQVSNRALQQTVVFRGNVVAAAGQKVVVPGTSEVVTAVAVHPGQNVTEGQVLLALNGQPLITAHTTFPMYRDLSLGMQGPDVREVNAFLGRLSYPHSAADTYDARTAEGIRQLLIARGYPTPKNPAAPASMFAWLTRTPSVVGSVAVKVGDRTGDLPQDSPGLLTLNPGQPSVVATVDASFVSAVVVGQAATGQADGSPTTIPLSVGTVAQLPPDPSSPTPQASVTLTATSPDGLARFSGSLRIEVNVRSIAQALAVPVSGVFADPDGSTFVQRQAGGRVERVPVSIGLVGDGYAEVTSSHPADGAALASGDVIVVSSS